jgi:hypothetical protein
MVNSRRTGDDRYMLHACLEKAPRVEQAYCLQTPGHPGTHQAYVKDSLIEWEPLIEDDPVPPTAQASSTAA